MAFRSATVFIDEAPSSEVRLSRAIALTAQQGAHLDVVALIEEPPFNYVAGAEMAVEAWSHQVAEMRQRARALGEAATARITEAGLSAEARAETSVLGGISEIAALHGRYTDFSIVGQPAPDSAASDLHEEVLDGTLFGSGRPVLVLPEADEAKPDFGRIVVAWDAGRCAARAIGDALPFLKQAGEVSLALIDPKAGQGRHGQEPGADIARQLARHEIEVTLDRLPTMGRSVAECIHGHARDFGAGMIVMGGYGHSKLREQVFGGTTRDLLRQTKIPLFMSH